MNHARSIRLAQLSDVHITAEPGERHGIDSRANFLRALRQLQAEEADLDLLVLSGDLAALDGESGAYAWLAEQLAACGLPYVVMTGNHDRLERMQRIFAIPETDLQAGYLCYERHIKGLPLLFLDTADYYLASAQLDWLRAKVMADTKQKLLFIHHPPLLCDCLFMDSKHSLRNIAEAWPAIAALPFVQHIFCGHYHTERTLYRDGKNLYLTPSTQMQIGTKSEKFSFDSRHPGWRVIEWDGENLHTYVRYYCPS